MSMHRRFLFVLAIVFMFIAVPAVSKAATLALSPASGTVTVGKTVTVAVRVGSPSQAMNSAEATVTFPNALLRLQSISKSGSLFDFWTTEPAGSNASGRVVFSGGLPSPGFSGAHATILKITFLAKAKGSATLAFSNAKVLANDGLGTDILTGTTSATYTLAETAETPTPSPVPAIPSRPTPSLTSSSHPDENDWHATTSARVAWSDTTNRRGVSFSITDNPDDEPDDHDEAAAGVADVALPSDGVWYFHLKARYDSGWSATAHYALRRDTVVPEPFALTVTQDRGRTDPSPVVEFAPVDATSGIERAVMVLDGGDEREVTSPATLSDLPAGNHHIVVTAIDKAGNATSASADFITEGYPAPTMTSVRSPIILLQPVEVSGTAFMGDTVIVYLDDEELGRTVLGHDNAGVVLETPPHVPWNVKSDRLYRPGTYRITAKAVSPTGRESVLTDPVTLQIAGNFIMLGGKPFATLAFAPAALLFLGLIAALVLLVLAKLLAQRMRSRMREGKVKLSVQRLRQRVGRERVSAEELDATLRKIADDLGREAQRRFRPRTREPKGRKT